MHKSDYAEKESSYGKVFKVAGPCNFNNILKFLKKLNSNCCRGNVWSKNVRIGKKKKTK